MAKEIEPAGYQNTTSFEIHFDGHHVNEVTKKLNETKDHDPDTYEFLQATITFMLKTLGLK